MKKMTWMAFAVAAAVTMTACKSQKTLSQAAVVADPVEEVAEVQETKPITYAQPQRPKPVVKAGDRTESVTTVNASEAGLLRDYNVVVGSFTSSANAEGFKVTMQQRGYRGAYVVKNAEGWYRVVAASYDTRDEAEPVRDQIRAAYPNEKGTCADAWLLIPKR